jgi:itaconyl-CoA hydratase
MTIDVYREVGKNRYREDFGFYYEDFVEGTIIEHRPGRTLTNTDNFWFTLLTNNPSQVHFDAHYAAQTEWKEPLVDSTLTFAIVTGMSVNTISKHVVANLGWDDVRLTKPVFAGDTIYAESEILSKRETKSRPDQGIVSVETRGIKQTAEVFMTFKRTVLVYKRGHGPTYDI